MGIEIVQQVLTTLRPTTSWIHVPLAINHPRLWRGAERYLKKIPLWCKNYFELMAFENLQTKESSKSKSRSCPFLWRKFTFIQEISIGQVPLSLYLEEKDDSESPEIVINGESTQSLPLFTLLFPVTSQNCLFHTQFFCLEVGEVSRTMACILNWSDSTPKGTKLVLGRERGWMCTKHRYATWDINRYRRYLWCYNLIRGKWLGKKLLGG